MLGAVHRCRHLPIFIKHTKGGHGLVLNFLMLAHVKYDHRCVMQCRVVNCFKVLFRDWDLRISSEN